MTSEAASKMDANFNGEEDDEPESKEGAGRRVEEESKQQTVQVAAETVRKSSTHGSSSTASPAQRSAGPRLNLQPDTPLDEVIVSSMGFVGEKVHKVLSILRANECETWADLEIIKNEDEAIAMTGDERTGRKIWNYLQKKKDQPAADQANQYERDLQLAEQNKKDIELQDFLRAISNAKVEQKKANDSVSQGEAQPEKAVHCIVWEVREVVNDSDEADEEGTPPKKICVLTLPTKVPDIEEPTVSLEESTPRLLFITQSDLQIIQLAAGKSPSDKATASFQTPPNRLALVGNPGIGKSVLQWKILVLLLKPELWAIVKQIFETEHLKEVFPLEDEFPLKSYNRVVRITEGIYVRVFNVQGEGALTVKRQWYHPEILESYNSPETLAIWEPKAKLTDIPYSGLTRLRLIATVSPNISRYKDFTKNHGLKVYVPCPTRGELLAMAAKVYELTKNQMFSTEEVNRRISDLGPFTRYVFMKKKEYEATLNFREGKLNGLSIATMMKYSTIETNSEMPDLVASHFFLRMVVNRDNDKSFYISRYAPSSTGIQQLLAKKANIADLKALRDQFANNVSQYELDDPPAAKRMMFQDYIVTSIAVADETLFESWPLIKDEKKKKDSKLKGDKEKPPIKNMKIKQMPVEKVYELPKFEQMKPNVLYYPSKTNAPIADFAWKDDKGNFHIGQVSLGKKHEHNVEAYAKFLVERGLPSPLEDPVGSDSSAVPTPFVAPSPYAESAVHASATSPFAVLVEPPFAAPSPFAGSAVPTSATFTFAAPVEPPFTATSSFAGSAVPTPATSVQSSRRKSPRFQMDGPVNMMTPPSQNVSQTTPSSTKQERTPSSKRRQATPSSAATSSGSKRSRRTPQGSSSDNLNHHPQVNYYYFTHFLNKPTFQGGVAPHVFFKNASTTKSAIETFLLKVNMTCCIISRNQPPLVEANEAKDAVVVNVGN